MFKKIIFLFTKIKSFSFKLFFGSLVGKIEVTDKPLNWLSIVFLVAFDIFIFVNISNGMESQSENIMNPYVKYNYTCQSFFDLSDANKSEEWNDKVYFYQKEV